MKEIWKKIDCYENYEISNLGNVRRINKDFRCKKYKYLIPKLEKNGYLRIGLSKNNKTKFYSIHRLVAQAFVPNINNYPIVNHKDENKENNNVTNLEWCNHKYNSNYGSAKIKMSNSAKKRKVNQYDMNMNLLNTFNSIKEASDKTKSNRRWISQCCKKKYLTCNNFYWRYADK